MPLCSPGPAPVLGYFVLKFAPVQSIFRTTFSPVLGYFVLKFAPVQFLELNFVPILGYFLFF